MANCDNNISTDHSCVLFQASSMEHTGSYLEGQLLHMTYSVQHAQQLAAQTIPQQSLRLQPCLQHVA